jgi:hypothetical protein
MEYLVLAPPVTEDSASRGLIIPLIIQTIRRVPSGSVWIDGALNVSRSDPSGTDQIDAEHQATDLVLSGWLRLFLLDCAVPGLLLGLLTCVAADCWTGPVGLVACPDHRFRRRHGALARAGKPCQVAGA